MPIILNIETSTAVCSVAISNDSEILFSKKSKQEKSHASSLAVFINEGMKYCGLDYKKLDAVAVCKGPGSYTGLRIGVSTAKGICYGADKPLIAINTLLTMASGVINEYNTLTNFKNALFCPMIDARRMEVFTALYDNELNQMTEISADIIENNSYNEILKKQPIYFFGDGAEKCKKVLTQTNAKFIENIHPDAKNMALLSLISFKEKKFENTAYFEPFYLKDFIATIPKKNVYR